jgi:hypothetical protein
MKKFFKFFFKLYIYLATIFATIGFIISGIIYFTLPAKNKNLESSIKDKKIVKYQSLDKEKLAYLSFEKFWNDDMIELSKSAGLNNPIEYSFLFNSVKVTQKIYLLDFALFINDKKLINEFKKHGAKRGCEILKTKCVELKCKIQDKKGDK